MPIEAQNNFSRYSIPLLLFLFAGVFIRHTYGFQWDNDLFLAWATHDVEEGLGNAYTLENNYLPFYHYILYGYAWLLGDVATLKEWFFGIHLVTLLFDMLGAWFIYRWIDRRYDFNILLVLLMFNIGYTFNTLIWGQADSILATLSFISLFFAWRGGMVWAMVFYALAINMKLQAIVLLPVLGLLYIERVGRLRTLRAVLMPLVALAGTQFLLLLPFIDKPASLQKIWDIATGSVDMCPYISMNAYNMWYFIYNAAVDNPRTMVDADSFIWGLSHKDFGLLVFITASFVAMLPLLLSVWKRVVQKITTPVDRRQLWLVAAIVVLLFFYCNTQMHERYAHPAMIFIAAYAFYTRDFFPLVLFSVTYFLSLDKVLQWTELNITNDKLLIYDPVFLSALYLLLILYLAFRLVRVSVQGLATRHEHSTG